MKKAHIFFILALATVFSSCASHQEKGLSNVQEKAAQERHYSLIGNQADRFR